MDGARISKRFFIYIPIQHVRLCKIPFTSVPVLLELPLAVIERTDLSGLQPSGYAVEMECMVTNTPSYGAIFSGWRCLTSLTFDAKVHDVIPADSTVVDDDIPSPKSHR